MKSPMASNWTSPKSNLRTPRRSNKGKTGSKRIGPVTRTSTTIGKSDTIGLWNRWDRSQQFGPQRRSVSQDAYLEIATAHISLTECPLGPHQRRKSGHAGRVAARTRLGLAKWDPDRGSRSGVRQEVFLDVVAVGLEQHAGAAKLTNLLLGPLEHAWRLPAWPAITCQRQSP